jgi:4-amino-4-deoxy-L-arabinose transferase-like glycosyltransferase
MMHLFLHAGIAILFRQPNYTLKKTSKEKAKRQQFSLIKFMMNNHYNLLMSKNQRTTFFSLLGVGVVYFILFIFPNLTGARDANMLSVFEVDEFAQYPNLLHMLEPGATFYQSIHNFLVYIHYFYGYPFYFFSALAILPVRLLGGADWTSLTPTIVMILRQIINVLPMLLAIGLLVFTRTRFKSVWLSLGLCCLLLSVPGLVTNNLWWHPDSLAFLFAVLVFFFLDLDDLRFGLNFWLAAVACGIAFGIKYFGLYFALAIPLYIGWGMVAHKLTWRKALLNAGLFALVMAAAVVISNPLLLLPQERQALIANQKLQFQQTTSGIMLRDSSPYFQIGQYPVDFRQHYGEMVFILLGLGGLLLGLGRSRKRWLDALMLAWLLPMAYTINFAGTKRTHYWLPVVLLLVAGLTNYFLPEMWSKSGRSQRLFAWALGALLLVQMILFIRTDASLYQQDLTREQTSPAIAFYQHFDQEVLSRLEPDAPLLVYRDWHIYFPGGPHRRVEINWDLANSAYIAELKPDFILVEKANVQLFSDPATMAKAADPGAMQARQQFYTSVLNDQVPGYHLVFEDDFGYALEKNP